MKQLSSANYDLSGSRCFRQISHFIRNLALTRCSSSISFINLLGQQTSPVWLFLGRSTSNIQMLLFQPFGVPFYLGFLGQGTWKTRCSFTFFWLCVTVPSGPVQTGLCSGVTGGKWWKTWPTKNACQTKWPWSWHKPLQKGCAINGTDSQGYYPPLTHAQLLQHVSMHLKQLMFALERSGQPDEAGGIVTWMGINTRFGHIYKYMYWLGSKLNTAFCLSQCPDKPTNLLNIRFHVSFHSEIL